MENEILKIDTPELKGLEKSKAERIKSTFEPMAKMLAGFEKGVDDLVNEAKKEITAEITAKAKRLRIDIGRVRIETGKLKDKQKEYIKLEDKAIMGVHNILVWAVKEKEDKLREIENHFEIQEQLRLQKLQSDRSEKLGMYVEDAHERDLAKFEEDEFAALLAMKKKEHEDRIEAEKIAEQQRIAKEKADQEERKRIEKENERLRKEVEAREKQAKIEAAKLAKAEAARKAKEDAERKAYEAKLKFEREERERIEREAEELEAELKAKEDAERKGKEEKEAHLQAELNKGDAEKVNDLKKGLRHLKSCYSFKSKKNKKMYADVSLLIDKIIDHIEKP